MLIQSESGITLIQFLPTFIGPVIVFVKMRKKVKMLEKSFGLVNLG